MNQKRSEIFKAAEGLKKILESQSSASESLAIARQNELEEKLKEVNFELTQLTLQYKQLEDFCYIISHNLRSPVANLNMLCGLIKEDMASDELPVYIEKLSKVTDYLHSTLEELVDTIKVTQDKSNMVTQLKMSKVLEKVLDSLQGELLESKAKLQVDFSAADTILYSPLFMDSIFLNLISNSLRYRSDKRELKIVIRTEIIDDRVILHYSDNGLGLDLEKYGDALFKFKKTFHRHPEARGIGLFMVRSQIESSGGQITVTGGEDIGLLFRIELLKLKDK